MEKAPTFQENPKEKIRERVEKFLTLPERASVGNPEKGLAKKLGAFLVEKDFINGIDIWEGSWGCKYENGKIYINDLPMSKEQYEYYVFRLGENPSTGEQLFPKRSEREVDQYRFLHETSHAYQEYIKAKECPDSPELWYDKASRGQIKSFSALLFEHCYDLRKANPGKGLSTWGNVPDYNSIENQDSQNATRAIEDANELVTMYLWNPKYLDTFFDYISCEITGYGEADLLKDKLIKLPHEKKELLKVVVEKIIADMKKNINIINAKT